VLPASVHREKPRHARHEAGLIIVPSHAGLIYEVYLVMFVRNFGCVRFGLIRSRYQTVPLPFGSGLSGSGVASCSLHTLLIRDGHQVQREEHTRRHVQLTATITVPSKVDLAGVDVKR
jgi:hypothetical protein